MELQEEIPMHAKDNGPVVNDSVVSYALEECRSRLAAGRQK